MSSIDDKRLSSIYGDTLPTREFTIESLTPRGEGDDDMREFELAFSSEYPVMRYSCEEVLEHKENSVRLKRLNDKAPLLVEHDRKDQVGVIKKAWIDKDKVGRAVVRFGKSKRAEEIRQDVVDGIRAKVSVSYKIHKNQMEENKDSTKLPTLRVMDWEPMEISIVSVPADPTVGPGRSDGSDSTTHTTSPKEETKMSKKDENTQGAEQRTDEGAAAAATAEVRADAPKVDLDAHANKVRGEERQRVNSIKERAGELEKVKGVDELSARAISDGMSVSEFNSEALSLVSAQNSEARSKETAAPDVDLTAREQKQFNILRLANAQMKDASRADIEAAAFELEVCRAATDKLASDYTVRGSFIPDSAVSNMGDEMRGTLLNSIQQRNANLLTSNTGALVETQLAANSFIEIYRNMSALSDSGMQMLGGLVGNVDIPRQATSNAAGWVAENAPATPGGITFDTPQLRPKDASIRLEASRRMQQQGTPAIAGLIMSDLAANIALLIDKGGLSGSGAANVPTGIANQTGVSTVNFANDAPTYEEIVSMKKLVMQGNALRGMPRWIIESEGWEDLMTTPKQGAGVEGNFILNESANTVLGHPVKVSEQVDANRYFFGDFSQLLCGEWGGFDLVVDPYTNSNTGQVNWTVFKTVDFLVRHPKAFAFGGNTA